MQDELDRDLHWRRECGIIDGVPFGMESMLQEALVFLLFSPLEHDQAGAILKGCGVPEEEWRQFLTCLK